MTAPRRGWWRRPAVVLPVAAALLAVAGVALVVFQPWKLFVDDVVDEALPTAVATAPASPAAPTPSESAPQASPSPSATVPAGPIETARGTFVTHEHATTGSVRLLTLADGTQVLRIEDLDTSNGPDLRVWLSDQPVLDGPDGWFVFDDGDYLELGRLKGNVGDQNYVVPPGTDLDSLTSVSIWCARFAVSFGAAALEPA
ncbi:DM13 domain-containing protein [Longivirga aurantiaca]|uniref:DM13 domain-containing protein n=1 Tax=Longivirga aurantiaca TaxID=1837743 RepID=A0ABW1SZI5_9ACTN